MGDNNQVLIYTDGACSQNNTWKGGWATVIVEDDKINVFKGSLENTTNNVMELMAFKAALEYCYNFAVRNDGTQYSIHSDSAYILNCFDQKWYVNWRKNGWRNAKKEPVANKELWERILFYYEKLCFEGVNLTLIKVKGHSGDKYNEMADILAVGESK
jgi:ribonuclease HI